jgi:hypothetical protein
MNTLDGRRRSFFVMSSLLILSILVEQYALQPFFPFLSRLGGIRPMVVFLDIPLPLPESIDLIPTGLLFSFFYCAALAPDLSHAGKPARPALRKKVSVFFAGALVFLASVVMGGFLFYLLEGYLSREVRNGIDSFGLQADIYLPYPADSAIRLHGSMIMLATGWVGMRIWLRMVLGKRTVMPGQKSYPLSEAVRRKDLEEGIAAQMGKRITMQIPEPELQAPSPRGRMQPCVVDEEMLRPVAQLER